MSRSDRAIQMLMGAAFFAAGILKIADPLSFALSTARLRMVPMAALGPVAILLPWIEVVTAAALFLPKYRAAALRLILALLVVFTAVLAIGLIRGTATSCGCFGSGDGFLNRADVALGRNIVLLAMGTFVVRRKTTFPAAPASPA